MGPAGTEGTHSPEAAGKEGIARMGYQWSRRPLQIGSTGGTNKFANPSSFSGTVTVLKTLTASSQATITKKLTASSAATITKTLTASSQSTLTKAVSMSSAATMARTGTFSSQLRMGPRQTATTAATVLVNYGISSIARKSSAGASTQLYTLAAPTGVGILKTIFAVDCTSTRTARVTLTAASFHTTGNSTTITKATFNAGGDCIILQSVSTVKWLTVANVGSVAFT